MCCIQQYQFQAILILPEVLLNFTFWTRKQNKMASFFREHVVPAILGTAVTLGTCFYSVLCGKSEYKNPPITPFI